MTAGRAAVIAVGSNSTRLLTADLDGQLSRPVRGREGTALFLSAGAGGHLGMPALEKAADAVLRLKRAALRAGAEEISLIATSAVRDARDAPALAALLKERTGLSLRILSGREEALLSFLGATGLSPGTGRKGVLDIGGGSTEFITGRHGQIERALSLQAGAARLFALAPVDSPDALEKTRSAARLLLRGLPALRLPREWTLVGGTGTALIRVLKGLPAGLPFPEGSSFTRGEAEDCLTRLARLTPSGRSAVLGMPPGREHILPTGLAILCAAMERLHIPAMKVTERNNTDGFLLRHSGSLSS